MKDTILRHVRATIDQLPELYNWDFDESRLPTGVRLEPTENVLEKNLRLKQALNEAWLAGCENTRRALSDWYIKVWGGVNGNGDDTLAFYAGAAESSILARGTQGIASWSKSLTIRDPNRFAIFDARTSISLNALQLLNGTPNPKLFPMLPSKNSKVPVAQKLVKAIGARDKLDFLKGASMYAYYLGILSDVAKGVSDDVTNQMVEMLLFAQAEQLCSSLVGRYG
jgi:hypothetical protein